VHDERLVALIERSSAEGGGWLDADTATCGASYEAAVLAAGSGLTAVEALDAGEADAAFCAVRPPGHHATPSRAMGFCLFNNVAVAARRARDAHGVERVLVLDWDVHHGNGTNDIFHADPDVLYASIHESPLYPGSGPASDTGSGAGEGFTVNLPVPGGSGDAVWCSLVEHVVVSLGLEYGPGLILISAGFDAHARDPLATCEVTRRGFAQMAASMRGLADELDVPLGVVLEGGYDLEGLAEGTVATLEVVGADELPDRPPVDLHPLAAQAAGRLAERWPLVGTVAG
jgi:acetoin utilization deacetylase AcuC-like enzyme